MNLKSKINQWLQRSGKSPQNRGTKIRCYGCDRDVAAKEFHYIPDMVAAKSLQSSIVRTSATSGEMTVPGRFSIGGKQSGAFIYCQDCNKRLDVAEKKLLVWHIVASTSAHTETYALHRGNQLCAQIDKGL